MNFKFFKDDKFKSNSISLNISLDIDFRITDLNLVSELIKLGSKKYLFNELYSKLQDMYGAYFNCYINKCGEVAIFTIYLEFLKDEYIESSLWNEIIDFLHEVFYNVLEENGEFKKEFFDTERENLRKNILSLVDSKEYYAYVKCEELSTLNEPYSNYIYGDLDRLDKIDGKELYQFYLSLREMPHYFIITGSFDENKIQNLISQKFGVSVNKKFESNVNKFVRTDFVEKYERFDVSQTKLVINFKTPITIFDGDYYAFLVFNKILGGGYSKLYREIRQKRNLVYYVNSYYEKFKGMLSIECGIDDKNLDLTKELIFKEIEDISDGKISESELEVAKNNIFRLLMSIKDKIILIHSYITPLYIFDKTFDIDKVLENIKSVDIERVINVSKQILKSAVFSLRPLGGS